MKRVPFADMPCPVAQALELVGEWWTLLIVREALLGRRRFGEFQQELGIAKNVLSSRLRKLVAEGILERRASETDAREVEYRLTPKGKDLMPILIALSQWAERWIYKGKNVLRYENRHTGQEVPRLAMRDPDGTELTVHDLRVVRGDGTPPRGSRPRRASPAVAKA